MWVAKPGQSAFAFRTGYSGTSFSRWIQNYPGTHTFYVEACDSSGRCAQSNSVGVYLSERPTIPSVPGEPDVNWDLYHPAGSSVRVKIPSIAGATYYQVYNGTSSTSTSVSRTFYSSTWEYISSVSTGPNYIRIKACNSAGCSAESPPRRVVIFTTPSAPSASVSPVYPSKNATVTVAWNRPSGMIWSGAYFKVSCINSAGTDVCNQNIPHIGGSNKSAYSYSFTASSVSGYDIQVKACNKTDSYCAGSHVSSAYVLPAVHGDPGYNVDWDFYYPQNTTMSVKLPQSLEGADSFKVFYYADGSSPQLYAHVPKSQRTIDVNVGSAGKYNLALASCVSSNSGGAQCSAQSQARTIVSFIKPEAPILSITPNTPELNEEVTINWNRPNGMIWSGAYFKLSCVTDTGKDVCNQSIPHVGGSNKSQYSHRFTVQDIAQFDIQVKACNKTASYCTSSNTSSFTTNPAQHGDPSHNVNWDLYYPENSMMTVNLSQSLNGVDSFDVYYYPEGGEVRKVKHVSKAQGKMDINVGEQGYHTLQIASCTTSSSGSTRCGELSKKIRIVSFNNPQAPVISVTPQVPEVNGQATITWNRPDGLIWSGGYFLVSCKADAKLEACGQKISHQGGSNKTEYSHTFTVPNADKLDIHVKACNKSDAHCAVSKKTTLSTTPPGHGDPSYNVEWDFYYPQNTTMTVNLAQSIVGADSFDIYYYPEGEAAKKVDHAAKTQGKVDVNVGAKGFYTLQIASCSATSSGGYRCGELSEKIRIVSFAKPGAPVVSVTPASPSVNQALKIDWNRPDGLIWDGAYFKVSCVASDGTDKCRGIDIPHTGGSKKLEYSHELLVTDPTSLDIKVQACNKNDDNCTSSAVVRRTVEISEDFAPENNGKELTWQTVSGATSYVIESAVCAESCDDLLALEWSAFATLAGSDTRHKIVPTENQFYRIKACFGDGTCTQWTYIIKYTPKNKTIFIHTDLLGNPVAETVME
ncbi:hypothetical protein L1285_18840 [Pseudoalteromonas sp. DL2-H2.2]|uniref:hypothetical protein n=1 Tax=Pseudoalteromonas sp. DL2-H2.2 TaxID=2908889 RepID=UPI001F2C79B6|nr:hypothetical protein [Pseudoalteromonas sp. DL2-H2.2]MCF2910374.1 hypothetical protein [Pseudoalteromonas sp. DL2-H2.2]